MTERAAGERLQRASPKLRSRVRGRSGGGESFGRKINAPEPAEIAQPEAGGFIVRVLPAQDCDHIEGDFLVDAAVTFQAEIVGDDDGGIEARPTLRSAEGDCAEGLSGLLPGLEASDKLKFGWVGAAGWVPGSVGHALDDHGVGGGDGGGDGEGDAGAVRDGAVDAALLDRLAQPAAQGLEGFSGDHPALGKHARFHLRREWRTRGRRRLLWRSRARAGRGNQESRRDHREDRKR